MSGSSLDGLDMALCSFEGIPGEPNFNWEILETEQVEFPDDLAEKLKKSTDFSAKELCKLDSDFGFFLGEKCKHFIENSKFEIDAIASHGHTIFHFPDQAFTLQIGNGAAISQLAKKEVICDFRSSDIAAGGLGAPFAPIVDFYIFNDSEICLNLGGISNITFKNKESIQAFDISPCNQLLNFLAGKMNLAYDENGKIAAQGQIDPIILRKLKELNSFNGSGPRAIDNSWVVRNFLPVLESSTLEVKNLLRTCVEFIADEIIFAILENGNIDHKRKILITGGGGFNLFFIKVLEDKLSPLNIKKVTASYDIINYKEALLIALMGYLRKHKKPNALKSVTGALEDTIGGCIYIYN